MEWLLFTDAWGNVVNPFDCIQVVDDFTGSSIYEVLSFGPVDTSRTLKAVQAYGHLAVDQKQLQSSFVTLLSYRDVITQECHETDALVTEWAQSYNLGPHVTRLECGTCEHWGSCILNAYPKALAHAESA